MIGQELVVSATRPTPRAAATTAGGFYREIKRWQKHLNKMVEKPGVEQADIANAQRKLADATRQYYDSLDSGDSASG